MQQDQYYNAIYHNSNHRINHGPQLEREITYEQSEQGNLSEPLNNSRINLPGDKKTEEDEAKEKQGNYVRDHQEYHIGVGEYLKSAIYGGTDGVVNSLAVIVGGIASGTLPSVIFGIGISVMIGDGLGMGLGDYLSAKSEKQFIKSQEKRQFWEVQNRLQDQKDQIIQIYKEKNYSQEDSRRLADLFSTNHQAFVNVMMLEQLGLVVDDSNPILNGVVNTLSFIILSFLPLIPYLVSKVRGDETHQNIWIIAIGAVELFSLGFLSSAIIGQHMAKRVLSGFQTLLFAGAAIAAGFGVGRIFQTD